MGAIMSPIDLAEQPAFPLPSDMITLATGVGLTKREYFAGEAMKGLLAGGMRDPSTTTIHALLCADRLIKKLSEVE